MHMAGSVLISTHSLSLVLTVSWGPGGPVRNPGFLWVPKAVCAVFCSLEVSSAPMTAWLDLTGPGEQLEAMIFHRILIPSWSLQRLVPARDIVMAPK